MNPKISGFTKEQLYHLAPQLLLAIIREKAHSSVELPSTWRSMQEKSFLQNSGSDWANC